MNFSDIKRSILRNNCRSNSFEHVLRILDQEKKKLFVELGTIREVEKNGYHEGYSTLLLGYLCHLNDAKLYSVDIDSNALKTSKNLINEMIPAIKEKIEFVNLDQFIFLEKIENIDFLFIDATEKDVVLSKYLHKLNDDAVILIDDMCTISNEYVRQRNSCIEIVNNNPDLHLIEKIEYFELNESEKQYQKILNDESKDSINFYKYKSGVQQYPYQILLRYKKSKLN